MTLDALALKENALNKSNDVLDIASTSKFPVWKAITDWAVGLFATIANLNLKAPLASPTFTGVVTLPVGTQDRLPKYTAAGVLGNTGISVDASNNVSGIGTMSGRGIIISDINGYLNLTSTGSAAVSRAGGFNLTGYQGRGLGTMFQDRDSPSKWYSGMPYAGSYSYYSIGYAADGLQAEYLSKSLMYIYKTGEAFFNGPIQTNNLLKVGQYTTATEPAYVKGAQYFNTTLNKMRIGGVSVWETVTSA